MRVAGYVLAGAEVLRAEDDLETLAVWERLPSDIECLILTGAARRALGARLDERPELVFVVVPE